jgi:hypothetical protein
MFILIVINNNNNQCIHNRLFHFDDAYRPVPLEQRYIGVRASNPAALRGATYDVCYDKVLDSVKQVRQLLLLLLLLFRVVCVCVCVCVCVTCTRRAIK